MNQADQEAPARVNFELIEINTMLGQMRSEGTSPALVARELRRMAAWLVARAEAIEQQGEIVVFNPYLR